MECSDKMVKRFFMAFGVGFLILGAILIAASLLLNAHMDNCRQVTAVVTDVIISYDSSRDMDNRQHDVPMYSSVYEYTDGGEVKTYTSNVSSSRRAETGSEVTLYISGDGRIYERSAAAVLLTVGIIFAFVGGIFTVICLTVFRRRKNEGRDF